MADEVYYLNEYGDRVGYGDAVHMVTKSVVKNSPTSALGETVTVSIGRTRGDTFSMFFKNPKAKDLREIGKKLLALADEVDRW